MSPDIYKDIISACTTKTINVIIRYVGDLLLSILVDESPDVSTKEQMSFMCCVDSSRHVNERIIVAKKNLLISNFFRVIGDVVNVVASCKCLELLREKHSDVIVAGLERVEILSDRGLRQETTVQRAGDAHWGSHYNSLINFISMLCGLTDAFEIIQKMIQVPRLNTKAFNLLESILSFNFSVNLH
ncbi:uncharacterized protein LOC142544384 [Primulina tabacum]|uniref:uncharacterized protein LOC142544384 n=1 Tax=Primulina tabacum TaxID=48773 RepID=UPI003F59563C